MAQEIEVKVKVAAGEAVSNVDKISESFVSLKQQLRNAQNEVTALSEKFGATSREAVNAAKRAGQLKDKISDAKALTDAFNPDAKFKALSASLTGVAGGFSVVTGAMGAFGANTKDVEESLLKVQSAMAIASGAQAVGESIDSFKQLGAVIKNVNIVQLASNFIQTGSLTLTRANTAATEAQAVATNVSTVATAASTTGMKLFRIALIGTGIGAIVVALGLLIANFDKIKETVLRVVPGLSKVGDVIGGIVDSITDFVGATSDASRALDSLKKDAENTLLVNKKFMQEHGDQVDAYTKKKIDAKNAYAEAVKEDGADQVALANRLNRELAAIEFSRGDEKRKIQKEANEKASAEAKSNSEKATEKEKEKKIKATADETKRLEDAEIERQALISRQGEKAREEYEAAEKLIKDARKANEDSLKTENQLKIEKENEEFELTKQNLIDKGLSIEEIEKEHKRNIALIDKTENERKLADAQALADKQIAIELAYQDAKRNALDTGLGILQQFAGKNKGIALAILAVQKGLAISDVVIGAAKSISLATSALAAVPAVIGVVPNPMYAVQAAATIKGIATTKIGAATSIASILASGIGTAASITAGGSSTASSSGGGGGISTPSTMPVNPNVVSDSGVNQLAKSLSAVPLKTYVVAKDVTSQQSLDRNITDTATLG